MFVIGRNRIEQTQNWLRPISDGLGFKLFFSKGLIFDLLICFSSFILLFFSQEEKSEQGEGRGGENIAPRAPVCRKGRD